MAFFGALFLADCVDAVAEELPRERDQALEGNALAVGHLLAVKVEGADAQIGIDQVLFVLGIGGVGIVPGAVVFPGRGEQRIGKGLVGRGQRDRKSVVRERV